MSFLAIFMTGLGLSMDAFAVASAKGMSLKKNVMKNALKIAIFFKLKGTPEPRAPQSERRKSFRRESNSLLPLNNK